MSRPIDITDLPNDVTALRGVIDMLMADLSAERAARQAAEAGLRDKALEAEHLRAQLARLRRMQFGQSSERLRDQIVQLELALRSWRQSPPMEQHLRQRRSRTALRTNHPPHPSVAAASRCPSTCRAARWSIAPPHAPAHAVGVCCARSART